ncbi:Midasin [Porphyridium purpureum]|uniref:Midasin n=1 Tax=Porphyridium purpureum TaxID=35688 RepID=A0A5J4YWI1_PORPP|nr:Midasin [Porphyridium purpureum]|eukprot:POR1771..scf227_4
MESRNARTRAGSLWRFEGMGMGLYMGFGLALALVWMVCAAVPVAVPGSVRSTLPSDGGDRGVGSEVRGLLVDSDVREVITNRLAESGAEHSGQIMARDGLHQRASVQQPERAGELESKQGVDAAGDPGTRGHGAIPKEALVDAQKTQELSKGGQGQEDSFTGPTQAREQDVSDRDKNAPLPQGPVDAVEDSEHVQEQAESKNYDSTVPERVAEEQGIDADQKVEQTVSEDIHGDSREQAVKEGEEESELDQEHVVSDGDTREQVPERREKGSGNAGEQESFVEEGGSSPDNGHGPQEENMAADENDSSPERRREHEEENSVSDPELAVEEVESDSLTEQEPGNEAGSASVPAQSALEDTGDSVPQDAGEKASGDESRDAEQEQGSVQAATLADSPLSSVEQQDGSSATDGTSAASDEDPGSDVSASSSEGIKGAEQDTNPENVIEEGQNSEPNPEEPNDVPSQQMASPSDESQNEQAPLKEPNFEDIDSDDQGKDQSGTEDEAAADKSSDENQEPGQVVEEADEQKSDDEEAKDPMDDAKSAETNEQQPAKVELSDDRESRERPHEHDPVLEEGQNENHERSEERRSPRILSAQMSPVRGRMDIIMTSVGGLAKESEVICRFTSVPSTVSKSDESENTLGVVMSTDIVTCELPSFASKLRRNNPDALIQVMVKLGMNAEYSKAMDLPLELLVDTESGRSLKDWMRMTAAVIIIGFVCWNVLIPLLVRKVKHTLGYSSISASPAGYESTGHVEPPRPVTAAAPKHVSRTGRSAGVFSIDDQLQDSNASSNPWDANGWETTDRGVGGDKNGW